MKKTVEQIRDLELIEKELNTCPAGILALIKEHEKVIQIPTTFLYQDKNIYIFLDDNPELYESIHFDTYASFALIKNEKVRRNPKNDFTPSYQSFSVMITGNIRKVEEQKEIEEVKINYLKKYSKGGNTEGKAVTGKAVIIDTEEIQAIEETGG